MLSLATQSLFRRGNKGTPSIKKTRGSKKEGENGSERADRSATDLLTPRLFEKPRKKPVSSKNSRGNKNNVTGAKPLRRHSQPPR